MKSIFIVLGVTGEDDQQRSWLVKAFPSERDAIAYIDKLESTYQNYADEENFDEAIEDQLVSVMKNLDENFEFDPQTGTEYSITECPFEDSARPANPPRSDRRPFERETKGRSSSRESKGPRRSPRR